MHRVIALLAAGVALLYVPAEAGSAPVGNCGPRGAVRVVAGGERVIVVRRGETRYFACLRGSRRARSLGRRSGINGEHGPERFVVAGVYVAYVDVVRGRSVDDLDQATVHQIDLRSRRTVRAYSGVVGEPLVTRRGSLVIVTDGVERDGLVRDTGLSRTLRRFDSRGSAILDEGPGIVPESLAATGSGTRVFWLRDATARTGDLR